MIHYFDDFLKKLRQKDELLTVNRFIEPNLEIAEITDRQASLPGGGKALLFNNTGTDFPVISNIFSSENRILMAFDMESTDEIYTRISGFYKAIAQNQAGNRFLRKPPFSEITQYAPKTGNVGSCQEIALFPPDLNRIPFLRNRPYDQAHSIHEVPLIIRNPYMNSYSIESTRLLWHSKTTVQVRFEPGSQSALLINNSPQGRIPIALFFGGDPLYTLTSMIPRSVDVDPLLLNGYLRKKPIIMVPCLSQPLEVPENCDLVIEGYIDKNAQTVPSVACGDNTGFYSIGGKEPLMHVTCITHRKNAMLPMIVPSLGQILSRRALTRIISAFVETNMEQSVAPGVRQLCYPYFGRCGSAAIVAIKKFYPGQTHKTAHAFWGSGITSLNKVLVLVDEHVDVYDRSQVNECIRQHYNPSRDTFFGRGPLSLSDHAAPQRGFGGKICLDATAKSTACTTSSSIPAEPYQFYHKSEKEPLKNRSEALILISVDEEIDLNDRDMCLWMAISQTDPIRDTRIENGILYVDACTKKQGDRGVTKPWPNVCCSSMETIQTVDSYWDRLKAGDPITSPSYRIQALLRKGKAQIME